MRRRRSRVRWLLKWAGTVACPLTVVVAVPIYRWHWALLRIADLNYVGWLAGSIVAVQTQSNTDAWAIPSDRVAIGPVAASVATERDRDATLPGILAVPLTTVSVVSLPVWVIFVILAVPTGMCWWFDPPRSTAGKTSARSARGVLQIALTSVLVGLGIAWMFSLFIRVSYVENSLYFAPRCRLVLMDGVFHVLWLGGSQRDCRITAANLWGHGGFVVEQTTVRWSQLQSFSEITRSLGLVWFSQERTPPMPNAQIHSAIYFNAFPLWIPITLVGGPTIWLWRHRRPRIGPGRCTKCGYDLTGNLSGRCPECGSLTRIRE